MKYNRLASPALLLLLLITSTGCERADVAPLPNPHGTAGAGGGTGCTRAAVAHRAAETACDRDRMRPPGDELRPNEVANLCSSDDDCSAGQNGRCIRFSRLECTYDACFSDDACATGGPCECDQGKGKTNVCGAGNCQADGDCPESGFCSPSPHSCVGFRPDGYYCHTCKDECVNSSDCPAIAPKDNRSFTPICYYDTQKAHWACGGASLCNP